MITILHRYTGAVLAEGPTTTNDAIVTAVAAGKDLQGAYLQGAYLRGADLQGADLQGADLQHADLQHADLQGAYLQGAYLQGAYLQGAYLRGAYLRGAYLRGAYLRGAYLQGAYLRGAKLPDGRTLEEYIAWLPEGLLTQGGQTVEHVASCWGEHSWTSCPMHCAFTVDSLSGVPECHRQAAGLFVALYDGRHLPKPGSV